MKLSFVFLLAAFMVMAASLLVYSIITHRWLSVAFCVAACVVGGWAWHAYKQER